MTMPRLLTLCLSMAAATIMMAQQPLRVEYYLDNDPGYGAAKKLNAVTVGDNSFTFDLSDALPGAHVLYVRCQDSEGRWSSTVAHPLFVRDVIPQKPTRVEYFIDDDPGYGMAATITNLKVGDNAMTFDLQPFKDGAHVLYVRSQDETGKWSTTMSRPLFINRYQDIVYVEYFYDGNDPGRGKATSVPLPDGYKGHLTLDLSLDITGLALGEHQLSVRALDFYDQWTDVMTRSFTVVEHNDDPEPYNPPVEEGDLARLEYFFDTDPGYGNGTPLSKPSTGTNTYVMSFEGLAPGAHLLCLRAWDDENHWSQTLSHPIYVCSVMGQRVANLEYFFDTDPGFGKASKLSNPANGSQRYVLSMGDVPSGAHVLYLRAQDEQGKWSSVLARPLFVTSKSEGTLTAMEYFFDNQDPGEGKANKVTLPDNPTDQFAFEVSVEGLAMGSHQFSVRAKDEEGNWSMVRSEPFTITSGEGIVEVTWDFTINMRLSNGNLTLEDQTGGNRGNCMVELYTASGMTLAVQDWQNDVPSLSISLGALSRGGVIIVKVTDRDRDKTVIRRLLMKDNGR